MSSLYCYQSLIFLPILSAIRALFNYVHAFLSFAPPLLKFSPLPDHDLDLRAPVSRPDRLAPNSFAYSTFNLPPLRRPFLKYHHGRYLDPVTGAFPSKPLPHLPLPFKLFEDVLAIVNCVNSPLSLGEDNSEYALARRDSSERWRSTVRAVSNLVLHIARRVLSNQSSIFPASPVGLHAVERR